MIKAIALWGEQPDPEHYAKHCELARTVPGVTLREGRVFGSPPGTTPAAAWFAELEFEDMDAFKRAASSPEFAATGEDAASFGIPLQIFFTEVE